MHVRELVVTDNEHLESLENAEGFRNLAVLRCRGNRLLGNIGALKYLERLRYVDLSNNAVICVLPLLASAPGIEYLNLANNRLGLGEQNTLCDVVNKMAGLQHLDLSMNGLAGVRLRLPRLRVLNLHGNELRGLGFTLGLPSLQSLRVTQNNITDAGELRHLQLCRDLRQLCIAGNPVSLGFRHKHCIKAVLQLRMAHLDRIDGLSVPGERQRLMAESKMAAAMKLSRSSPRASVQSSIQFDDELIGRSLLRDIQQISGRHSPQTIPRYSSPDARFLDTDRPEGVQKSLLIDDILRSSPRTLQDELRDVRKVISDAVVPESPGGYSYEEQNLLDDAPPPENTEQSPPRLDYLAKYNAAMREVRALREENKQLRRRLEACEGEGRGLAQRLREQDREIGRMDGQMSRMRRQILSYSANPPRGRFHCQ